MSRSKLLAATAAVAICFTVSGQAYAADAPLTGVDSN